MIPTLIVISALVIGFVGGVVFMSFFRGLK